MNTLTLVLLTMSLHTSGQDFNNQNYGIGVEYTDNFTYGIYSYYNSYNKQSTMLSISKQWEDFGIGIGLANSYQDDVNAIAKEYLIAPEITYKFNKYFRLKTTAPFGSLVGSYDVVNFQVTYGFD